MNPKPSSNLTGADLDRLVSEANQLAHGHGQPPLSLAGKNPVEAAIAFGQASNFERPHAFHVAALSLSIFDQLVDLRGPLAADPSQLWTKPRSRVLLHLAALLHDVGCAVSYAGHHKHSHAMISASRLPGLSRQELALVAVVARYHRKSPPKLRHEMYAALAAPERELVRHLAGILRVGDALDRAHTQCVTSASVSLAASALVITAHAPTEPTENLEACLAKGRMLESVLGVELAVRWRPNRRSASGARPSQQSF